MVLEIIVVLAISIVVSVYISIPFFMKNKLDEPNPEEERNLIQVNLIQRLKGLHNEKDSVYNSIKDIEFDYEIGKLSKNDFEELDMAYKSKAISLLKGIDEIESRINLIGIDKNVVSDVKAGGEEKPVQDAIEREILQFRKSGNDIDPYIKCLNCGKECNPDDIFCSKCGNNLRF